MNRDVVTEGWWLMSPADLEIELRRWRSGAEPEGSNAIRLTVEEALRIRDAGNLPDELDRSLRLVLRVDTVDDLRTLDVKRSRYEPDHHDAPTWRREGSRPVNVVPLRSSTVVVDPPTDWMADEDMRAMERQWAEDGAVAGLRIPSDYRSFIYKTVLALQQAGRPVTVDSVADSLERWLAPQDVERIRTALRAENETS